MYSDEISHLPAARIERPGQFSAEYFPTYVSGWLTHNTKRNEKRKYIFKVYWNNGNPSATISVADVNLGIDFGYRNDSVAVRELKGLPKNSRKDLQDYALRISAHVRDYYFAVHDFLQERVKVSDFIFVEKDDSVVTELYRDGYWLIKKIKYRSGDRYAAKNMGKNANDDDFRGEIEALKDSYAVSRRFMERLSDSCGDLCDDVGEFGVDA